MRFLIKHKTEYLYQQPTTLSYNEAWMFPRELPYQKIISTQLRINPEQSELNYRKDYFGNQVAYFSIQVPHTTFNVTAESIIERLVPENTKPENQADISWKTFIDTLQQFDASLIEARSFTLPSPVVPVLDDLKAYAKISFDRFESIFEAINDLNTRIFKDFEYNTSFTTVATPLVEVVKARKGVCQDFAHIAIGCLRAMGLPARYISGYIETLSPEGEPELIGTAASHAWFSTFIPNMGWVDFDPTNNQLTKKQHVTVAWGRDYQDVPPLKGVIFNSANHELSVGVEVRRLG